MITEKYNVSILNNDLNDEYKVTVQNNVDKKTLFYKEKDGTNTSFDYQNNILKRDNNEMNLEFKFIKKEKTMNYIFIKDLGKNLDVEIFTKEIENTSNKIQIIYEMNDIVFEYKLEKE